MVSCQKLLEYVTEYHVIICSLEPRLVVAAAAGTLPPLFSACAYATVVTTNITTGQYSPGRHVRMPAATMPEPALKAKAARIQHVGSRTNTPHISYHCCQRQHGAAGISRAAELPLSPNIYQATTEEYVTLRHTLPALRH